MKSSWSITLLASYRFVASESLLNPAAARETHLWLKAAARCRKTNGVQQSPTG